MIIELRGIIEFYNDGHKHVQVVVDDGSHVQHAVHLVGIDIAVNRGIILNFLAQQYSVPPGKIVWPDYITVKQGDD